MNGMTDTWDYLIVTASNDEQSAVYEDQLALRRRLGLLAGVDKALVAADPGGRRVGSGGSTLFCLMSILQSELGDSDAISRPQAWEETLGRLRILIVHAGGDSKRLPAYGPCGKIFIPVPCESDSAVGATLFDQQIPTYLALPAAPAGSGQVVITSGDVLLRFDPAAVRFELPGVTGLGAPAAPERARNHGVYCAADDGRVRLFLQKPSPAEQLEAGAVDRYGRSVLDIGVMSFDAGTAVTFLKAFAVAGRKGTLAWTGELGEAIDRMGLDFYREVCCAMGSGATAERHAASARASGSKWDEALLRQLFEALRPVPLSVQVLPQCTFLHFGTTRQIIESGLELLRADRGASELRTCLTVNTEVADHGAVSGASAWVEASRVTSQLTLAGGNVIVGADVDRPLDVPEGACLDVIEGRGRDGRRACFVRCYGVDDKFKDTVEQGATFCGRPVTEWLAAVGLEAEQVWDRTAEAHTVWDARLFPAVDDKAKAADWLWMYRPESGSAAQKAAYRAADRYSLAEIASLADHQAFYSRRSEIRAGEIGRSLRHMFRLESDFSAADLAHTLGNLAPPARSQWVSHLLAEARWHHGAEAAGRVASFAFSRIMHTLGSALLHLASGRAATLDDAVPALAEALPPADLAWLDELGVGVSGETSVADFAAVARNRAFSEMGRAIVASGDRAAEAPKNALRSDEIVWGRAPARLDLGGGWSDTPPYSLENGGCVINAAVDLNGQPPIHCYGRVIEQPVVRMSSIDLGARIEITELPELLDFRSATGEFALAKAALALSGFSPEICPRFAGASLRDILGRFGGGIELTTLAAIPKGSGLGTSSIVAAVILAVVQRMMGRELTRRELFHGVLRLEQALTTGGGWQDQIGGAIDGVKVITTDPGLVPDATIHYVPKDVLDPHANGGRTLLYYTGVTRLAKNILQQVVGRYLDRDRIAMATLRQIHALPRRVADAMAGKDLPAFGAAVDAAWRLNNRLDPNSTNDAVEAILERVRPHVHGAKLLGAGGGGFLLMVCKSPEDAAAVRKNLAAEPPNDRARFFDFGISGEGLIVTVC